MAIDHDHGWCSVPLSQFVERLTRRNLELDSNVLTISATRGLVSQRDYFGKQIASENLASYYRLLRGEFAYNKSYSAGYPLGAIKRLDAYDSGVVSPLYICFSLTREDVAFSDYFVQYVEAGRLDENLRSIAAEGARNHGLLNVKPAEFLSLPVTLPPLPEQKKIAAILSSVDETIAKTESVIAQLQIVKKAMMEQLLTKGMPGRHTRFKQTEIGEIPEEWEVVELSSVATVQTGIAKGKTVGEEAISVPYLRVANVQDGFIDLTEIKEIEVAPEQLPRFSLQTGDVLFCEGGDADKVGRGTVWLGQITPCLHQNHVFAVRPQLSKLLPEFLSLVRSGNSGRQYFLDSAKQTTNLASINSTQLKAFPTPLPSIDEQHEIVAVITSTVAELEKEQSVLSACRLLKASLSSSLLSGEIRVIPEVA